MRLILTVISLLVLAAGGSAQVVSLSLNSPQAGRTVAPGATVEWSIDFSVSGGNNAGLALLVVDLIQAGSNPALFDIPPASSVPAALNNFDRPAGISNPGETYPASGFTGVQRGTAGRRNLLHIGGAQNTFGRAMPGGTGVAESATVVGGVGQSGTVVLASGSFTAPATHGSYTYQLSNAAANVLTAVHSPPTFSPVMPATVSMPTPSITFMVGTPACPGDLDGDFDVDIADLSVLLSQFGTTASGLSGDLDDDGDVDISDLSLMLSVFGTIC